MDLSVGGVKHTLSRLLHDRTPITRPYLGLSSL